MDKIKLFNFIEDNHVFEGIGSFFLVVDEKLQIHFITYNQVKQDSKLCVGDYLKCDGRSRWMRFPRKLPAVSVAQNARKEYAGYGENGRRCLPIA